jgi:methyl-accepting chemotaxis protein
MEFAMFRFVNRVSVNVLLKSVIAIMAATVMIVLAINARKAWNRVAAVERIGVVADVSADMFTALHNLRVDRATTSRDLNADAQFSTLPEQLKETRGADLPALKSAVAALAGADFPEKQSAFASLSQAVSKLETLHQQTAAALAAPKSARPPGLAKEYFTLTTSLMDLLDNISAQMNRSVKLEDSYIDQLIELKQLAWLARNGGGDASVVISNTLGGLPLPPDPMTKYMMNVSKVDTAWAALEGLGAGLPVPERFT